MVLDNEMAFRMLAILVWKLGGRLELTCDEIEAFRTSMDKPTMLTHFHAQSVELLVMPLAEADKLAAKHEGPKFRNNPHAGSDE